MPEPLETGTPATTPPAVPAATGTPAVTPAVAAATPATPTGFTYTEDRSKWIPPHRLSEESTKAATAAAALAEANKKIAALAGVSGTPEGDAKADAVRQAFLKLHPQLEPLLALTKEQIAELTKTPEQLGRVSQQEQREQAKHGKAMVGLIGTKVAEAIGAEKLTDSQQKDLRNSFSAWFREKANDELKASNGESSATLQRYEEGEEALLDEFVNHYTSNWIDPARRKATAQVTTRTTQRVPNSTGRSQVTTIERPATFKSIDDRIEYAAKLARERGHSFADR